MRKRNQLNIETFVKSNKTIRVYFNPFYVNIFQRTKIWICVKTNQCGH